MNFDFLFLLLWATIATGLITLVDTVFWKPKRGLRAVPVVVDNARGFFPILLLVLVIRSFLYQPFKVPTESLEPTLLPGDFLLVNQYQYGLRMPVWHNKFYNVSSPKRGDIVVFRWPVSPDINFVKRVVGVPGDEISYVDKVLIVNGIKASQKYVGSVQEEKFGVLQHYQEDLLGVQHDIYVNNAQPGFDFEKFKVPKGYLFMMGDNRDASDDSRFWGLVRDEDIIGQATRVWLSLDPSESYIKITNKIRFKRFGIRLFSRQNQTSQVT